MRVIAGKARRLLLKTIDGLDTRPTTDRIKETLFNILNPDLPGSRQGSLYRDESQSRRMHTGKPSDYEVYR